MSAEGTYERPQERFCWTWCSSCSRCQDKGKYAHCVGCSGRFDTDGHIEPDLDDYCDCKNGNLRWKTQQGRRVIVKFRSNPFKAQVKYEKHTEDERDWDSYVHDAREKMDNPNWNPVTVYQE